jgi:hypothetical protein
MVQLSETSSDTLYTTLYAHALGLGMLDDIRNLGFAIQVLYCNNNKLLYLTLKQLLDTVTDCSDDAVALAAALVRLLRSSSALATLSLIVL